MGLRQFSFKRGALYIIMQLLGSILAALSIIVIIPYQFEDRKISAIQFPRLLNNITPYKAFIMQFISSGFYVWTYYAVIVDIRAPSNIFGFALGAVVSIANLSFGPMTGGCVNLIKYLGPRIVVGNFENWSAYFVAPLLGGVFSGFYFDFFVLKTKRKAELIDMDKPEDGAPKTKKHFNLNDTAGKKPGFVEPERKLNQSSEAPTGKNSLYTSQVPVRNEQDAGMEEGEQQLQHAKPQDKKEKIAKQRQLEEEKRAKRLNAEENAAIQRQQQDVEDNLFSF